MNLAQALHTAARRYCVDQVAYWSNRYSELGRQGKDRVDTDDGWTYTPEALATFPRYNVLNAIRVELERLDPEKLVELPLTRELVLLAGATAEDDFTRKPLGAIDAAAISDGREAFCQFVVSLSAADLGTIESLPYRRVLSDDEAEPIWSRLRQAWHIAEGYWYPLAECSLSTIVAFQDRAFHEAMPPELLRTILKAHGIERVWELREYGPGCEQDVSSFEPYYNGAEGYWSSSECDWIMYASHESSMTVGGWLLREIQAIWPDWRAKVWTSPVF
jgi:hypothetical protein